LRVATHLQIPFVDIDLSRQYQERIFELSMDAYRRGETPNPDALCNREIKFGLMYDYAMAHGADFLATGHYARTHVGHRMSYMGLYMGKDPEKDQSYFLWAVPEERLRHTLFPVGDLHKKEVRALAKKFGLPNAERRDSQGLCFLGGVSMEMALVKELAPVSGAVLNTNGAEIGTHRGAVLYTVGQRHGFDVHARSANTEPLYVLAKDAARNTITVGENDSQRHASGHQTVVLREENWIGDAPSGAYHARFRYRQKLFRAMLNRSDHATVEVATEESIPIGQSLVLYDGERCIGGGIIACVN
jgi:tRNA-specific 2-thiouridylase